MALVNVREFFDKDIFVSNSVKSINVRRSPSLTGEILGVVKKGERIGKVKTWVYGLDAKGNNNTEIWFQLYEKYKNPSGFGAYVKFSASVIDSKTLRQQGLKTTEERLKEEEEKKKEGEEDWFDRLLDGVGKILPWVAVAYVAGQGLKGRASRPETRVEYRR